LNEQIRINKISERGGTVQVVISTLEKPLLVSTVLMARHRLVAGVVITPAQLEQLQHEAAREQCHRETARLLALREHAIGEIRMKLRRKQFASDIIDETVRSYQQRGLLNDSEYALNVGRKLIEKSPSGRAWLIACLQKKMIPRSIAEQAADILLSSVDELDLARRALQKRWAHFSQFDIETARRKAYTYLSRRGIGYHAARTAFDQLAEHKTRDQDN